jgi:hypothetical protein
VRFLPAFASFMLFMFKAFTEPDTVKSCDPEEHKKMKA